MFCSTIAFSLDGSNGGIKTGFIQIPSWGSGGCVRLHPFASVLRPLVRARLACARKLCIRLAEALSTPWSPLHFTVLLVVSICSTLCAPLCPYAYPLPARKRIVYAETRY